MPLPQLSFSRSEIGARGGLDDDTLSYWIRAGLLVAEQGGGGKGRHLRFNRLELGVAVLLSRLRALGLSPAALMPLAKRFHDAVSWFDAQDLDAQRIEEVNKLLQAKLKFAVESSSEGESHERWKAFIANNERGYWFEPSAAELVATVTVDDWQRHHPFFDTLVQIALKRPTGGQAFVHLTRDGAGEWILTPPDHSQDAIKICLRSVGQQVWTGDE